MIEGAAQRSRAYESMRIQAVARVRERFDWERLLDSLFARQRPAPAPEPAVTLTA
jgi:hypothetical protein